MSLVDYISVVVSWCLNLIWGYPFLIIILVGLGTYFSLRTGFVQVRYFPEMIRLLGSKVHDENGRGISSFKAFSISVAGRVGVGNIVGVSIAVATAGPGAVFWMWLVALLGMSTSFVECLLAQVYKVKDEEGQFRGGPAYYIKQGLKNQTLSTTFAIFMVLTFGYIVNMFQGNAIGKAMSESFDLPLYATALILVALLSFIVFGGLKRLATMTATIVPVMALAYVGLAFYVILTNLSLLPPMLMDIFTNAFTGEAALSGTLGAVISMGVRRGLLSNEAGLGSAPAAAATASTSHPAKQGLVQSLSVFTDTIIICSSTAFIILLSSSYTEANRIADSSGIVLISMALSQFLGGFGHYFLSFAIAIFAFTTMISAYYYSESNLMFIIKGSKVPLWFKLSILLAVFAGPVTHSSIVWDLIDIFIGLTATINLYAIFRLYPVAHKVFQDYKNQKKKGLDPVFNKKSVPGLQVDCWD